VELSAAPISHNRLFTMAEVVAVLTTSWRLIRAINEVVARIEQTRDDARALTFLENRARTFLDIVNQGLVGVETSPYLGTIVSLEGLLNDILAISNVYIRMSALARFRNANQTKRTILDVNGRLRLFVDTYLLQTTTHAARVNLAALSDPVPVFDPSQPQLIPDDVQWEVMSRSGSAITAVNPQVRITSWMTAVGEEQLDGVQSNQVVDTQPARTEMVYPPPQRTAFKDPSRLHKCCHVWCHKGCPAIYRNALCCPIRFPVCVADCIGRCCLICWASGRPRTVISSHPNDPGCCTACMFEYVPLCMPELCMTKVPGESWGVHCVDSNCIRNDTLPPPVLPSGRTAANYDGSGARCSCFCACFWCSCCSAVYAMKERWKHR